MPKRLFPVLACLAGLATSTAAADDPPEQAERMPSAAAFEALQPGKSARAAGLSRRAVPVGRSVVLAQGLGGTIQRALECGTIGDIGLDRCKQADAQEPSSQYSCENGGSAAGLDALEQAVRKGMAAGGYEPRPDSVLVTRREDGTVCFSMRLDKDGRPLPTLTCIGEHLRAGNVRKGSIVGAQTWVLGCLQKAGGRLRANAREVDAGTGVVGPTGNGDATGTEPASYEEALRKAVEEMLGTGGAS